MSEIDSAILDESKARQPIFHHRELVHSAETFEGKAHPDFWEVGASGTVYSREEARATILRRLDERDVDEMGDDGWVTEQHLADPARRGHLPADVHPSWQGTRHEVGDDMASLGRQRMAGCLPPGHRGEGEPLTRFGQRPMRWLGSCWRRRAVTPRRYWGGQGWPA